MLRLWTEAEDTLMRKHYAQVDIAEMCRLLNRSEQAVRKRAQLLSLQSWRRWTEADRQRLRESWGKVPTRTLAAELGRHPNAVKQQAMKLGLDAGRQYTAAEVALVRELYPTHTGAQIAERIHGQAQCATAIYKLAAKLGLRKWPAWPAEVVERVRALHAEGLTDMGIARQMADVFDVQPERARLQVKHLRKDRLRLPVNTAAVKEVQRQSVHKQLRTLNLASVAELRTRAYQRFATENGWPEDCRPREVQILNVLAARGVPLTTVELANAIGMPTQRTFGSGAKRVLLSGNGPGGTYTASLQRRGLLVRLRHAGPVSVPGTSRRLDLYTLGPVALAILERRASCETSDTL